MEPDKTYPLHPDHDDQASTPSTPPVSSNADYSLPKLSTFNSKQGAPTTPPKSVPWYLQPLTKTTNSPMTSTQTRPFVPREPLQTTQQNSSEVDDTDDQRLQAPVSDDANESKVAISTVRSQQLPPLTSPGRLTQVSSTQPLDKQYASPRPTSSATPPTPRPFSQFSGDMKYQLNDAPNQPRKKSRRITGIIIAALIILVIGAVGYAFWRQLQSQNPSTTSQDSSDLIVRERLDEAIAANLQTRYVRQIYEQTTNGQNAAIVKLDTLSDFSDPGNPKSYIRYEEKSADNTVVRSGEIIVVDQNEFFAKVTRSTPLTERPASNQWYRVANVDSDDAAPLDPMSVHPSLNSSLGEMPIGNFDESGRKGLIKFIQDRNVYEMKKSEDIVDQDQKLTRYDIDAKAPLINKLNQMIAGIIGDGYNAELADFTEADVMNMQIWVDRETDRMTKVEFNREYTSSGDEVNKETITLSLSNPNDVSTLKAPDSSLVVPWSVGK